jgi:undecaprenyl diphosphate synthase
LDLLPSSIRNRIFQLEEKTRDNKELILNLALSYGGRQEIVSAVKRIVKDATCGRLKINKINTEIFTQYLHTQGIPDPDLFIRTGGEQRISNFLLWQLSYTELYFTRRLWPNFRRRDLESAILDFQKRQRRFGKTLKSS